MVPISHREGDYIATAGAPTDALQEVIPITVTHSDEVVFETTWRPGSGPLAADLGSALVAAVVSAMAVTASIDIIADAIRALAERSRHPAPIDPLHVRAREAIERLGLDGSRLELAVAVFGWGSDEANGSLLGLVRAAWGDPSAATSPDGVDWGVYVASATPDQCVAGWDTMVAIEDTVTEALVAALEARRP